MNTMPSAHVRFCSRVFLIELYLKAVRDPKFFLNIFYYFYYFFLGGGRLKPKAAYEKVFEKIKKKFTKN